MSTGTTWRNTLPGSASSKTAPAMPPATEATPRTTRRGRWPTQLRPVRDGAAERSRHEPDVLLTFATTGGNPNANRVGKVISEPEPTMVLIVPATKPDAHDGEGFEHGHGEGLPEWPGWLNTAPGPAGPVRHPENLRP